MKDELGDRMKLYEQAEAGRRALPLLPICARIDGRGFSRWTRGLRRPFDEGVSRAMIETAKFLVEETKARIGYTQSDEITLIFKAERFGSEVFFDGKLQKLVSVLASLATAKFNALVPDLVPARAGRLATFDARVWTVPSDVEAANVLVWREADASRNSVSMAARAVFSHRELDGRSTPELRELLRARGIEWENYPSFFKRGTFVRRRTTLRPIDPAALSRIPERHRPAAGALVERSEVATIDMPSFASGSRPRRPVRAWRV